MEFTFKLKKDKYEDDEAEIKCICGILQAIATITFMQGELPVRMKANGVSKEYKRR